MKKPIEGIAVDASTRGNPGPSQYRGVDIKTGKIIFTLDIGIATNNITEFLAVCHAILWCTNKNIKSTIYTDSQTALAWVKYKKAKSSLPVSNKTATALDYLARVESKLKPLSITSDGIDLTINNTVTLSKWYTSEWGEIPADFNLK
jgi:ribonuclease HI